MPQSFLRVVIHMCKLVGVLSVTMSGILYVQGKAPADPTMLQSSHGVIPTSEPANSVLPEHGSPRVATPDTTSDSELLVSFACSVTATMCIATEFGTFCV